MGIRDGLVLDDSLSYVETPKSNVVRIRVVLELRFFAVSLARYVYASTARPNIEVFIGNDRVFVAKTNSKTGNVVRKKIANPIFFHSQRELLGKLG